MRQHFSIYIDPEFKKYLQEQAKLDGRSFNNYLEFLLARASGYGK